MPEQKKVNIKNHPNPKLNITEKLKVEYVQLSYDNRYIIVKQNTFGTMWAEIVKVADLHMGKVFIEALVADIKDKKKKETALKKLYYFWNNIKKYNEVLDLETEN